ncbi:hypothetical protein C5167_042994 [Papaver somniferum]|uniref:Homer protein n=1 Tax=Papaver somniferum TaxID=3469 RepID=A0A4Y7L4E1_PAPSO|nr:uncharacterized protein LOC113315653 [Papaver somniferum]RZC80413.1 hypothetical protein C5167_042994 [Papaver somniferum]
MVEIQSCSVNVNIVNQSSSTTLCARNISCSSLAFSSDPLECAEKESGNVLAEVSAQLEQERQKNAELMERISLLEALLQDRATTNEQDHRDHAAADRSLKELKRQKIEPDKSEATNVDFPQCSEMLMEINNGSAQCMTLEMSDQQDRVVNWMSMDDSQFLNLESVKDVDCVADCEVDTDDTDDDDFEDEDETAIDDKDVENDENSQVPDTSKDHFNEGVTESGKHIEFLETAHDSHGEVKVQVNETNKTEIRKQRRKECRKTVKGISKPQLEIHNCIQETGHKGFGSMSSNNKPLKVPFCPKEVKKIIESEALSSKNAQSHTIRKIIVFASLGIRHGCEDMYDLNFSHFSILHKGEPYVSPKSPGEHVLYENPGVRRKVFYPNRQNATLCPIQIIEEEKAMRPSDMSCPSCLFLCIKYGGRTRNLPQNEYVRQRMGRNKLKSFGPLMCQMAMLVHVRSGSFFFKALGITLLFMAGFPDEIVQRETKYRNLDLLQKYYRKDENAEGEELFHLYPIVYEATSPNPQQLHGKATKSSAKKQAGLTSKSQNTPRALSIPSVPSSSVPSQFGLMGYTTLQNHALASFQGIPSHTQTDTPPISNVQIAGSGPNISYHTGQTPSPFPIIPGHPSNSFMPMMYWPHLNAFQSCPFPSSYGYRSFPHSSNYMTLPQPFYGHPFMTHTLERTEKKDSALLVETKSNSDSSSSIESKEA